MWLARRYIGVLLHLVPVAAAALGTFTAYSAWRLGERYHPTLTIQALAFRAADHLVRAAKKGDLQSRV